MALSITLGGQLIPGLPLPPFDGIDNGEKMIYVYGYITASGSYPAVPAAIASMTGTLAASGGNTVYQGTFAGGANNGLLGNGYAVIGYTSPFNNGTFTVVASTATTLTLNNANGIASSGQSGSATGTGGDILNFLITQPLISSGYSPLFVSMYSQSPAGASGYLYSWRPGTGLLGTSSFVSGRMQIFQSSGGVGPHSELVAGTYPSAILSDVIAFNAIFVRA